MKDIFKRLILVLGIVLLAGNASAYTYAECMADEGITDRSRFKDKMRASSKCQKVIKGNIAAIREKIAEITTATEIFKACMVDEDGNVIKCLNEADIIDVQAIVQAFVQKKIEEIKTEMAERVDETQACIKEIKFISLSKEERQDAIQECFSIMTENQG